MWRKARNPCLAVCIGKYHGSSLQPNRSATRLGDHAQKTYGLRQWLALDHFKYSVALPL